MPCILPKFNLLTLPPSDTGADGVQEAGMFLRMASGLGYCQVGDYVASLFFLFRRRGHRCAAICFCTGWTSSQHYLGMIHFKQWRMSSK